MHRRVTAPSPFEVLVGTYPHHTEPDRSPPLQPAHTRTAVLYGPIHTDGNAHLQNGLLARNLLVPTDIFPSLGTLQVANNDFTTGRAVIVLGNFRLISNIDFITGGAPALTAIAIAAAIERLPGYDAVAVGPGVVIGYTAGPADEIDFKVEHYGTITNFTPLVPADGQLAQGSPDIEPPRLT